MNRHKTAKKMSFLGFGLRESRRDAVFTAVTGLLTALIMFVPIGFGESGMVSRAMRANVKIVEVNNEKLKIIGPVRQGEQQLEITILSGPHRGEIHASSNNLMGKMEVDKVFARGDIAFAVLNLDENGAVTYAQVIDHYRSSKTIFLAAAFIAAVFIIMGWMGLKIVISFIFSAAALIRILYPMILRGWNPIAGSLIIIVIITALIMFLVGGLSRRALVGFLGAMSGLFFTALLAFAFTRWFKIHGAVRPFTETLLFSGYGHLNLAHLFIAGIFIAASGAVMDLAMDIAAAMDEIKKQQPAMSRLILMRSGFTVARQAAGTMSTTLLLAYSAEYTAMIMTFLAQGVPLENVINMVWVSSEVVHTLAGCFGLVLSAPLTVFAGGMLLGTGEASAAS
ncbi:MAG: YibE/F family protein [Spirochaetaceae bacterium]|nr:YibE/F family protein [Spirochaetaceae bacterium]